MDMFSFLTAKGIYLVELPHYRHDKSSSTYYPYDYKSSFLIYNATEKTSILIHVDHVRASTYDLDLNMFVINDDEKFLVAVDDRCYYMDKDGKTSPYYGDISSMYKMEVKYVSKQKRQEALSIDSSYRVSSSINTNEEEFNLNNIDSPYEIIKRFGDLLLCYKDIPDSDGFGFQRKYGICNLNGEVITEPKYDCVCTGCFRDCENYIVEVNEKSGLIDKTGAEILPPLYDSIDDCDGKIILVDYGIQLIRISDRTILFETEEYLECIDEGYIRMTTREFPRKPLGIIDSKGTFFPIFEKPTNTIRKLYDDIGSKFSDGLLPVYSSERGYGFVDMESNEIIRCKFNEIHNFENGRARVRFDADFGYIDLEGNWIVKYEEEELIIPNKYDFAYDFDNGVAIVQKGKLFGCVDKNINEIFPCVFHSSQAVMKAYRRAKLDMESRNYNDAYIDIESPIPFEDNKLFGFKRVDGIILCPPIFTVAHNFYYGLALVCFSGKYGYLNENLEFAIPSIYNSGRDFCEGLALVNERDYINVKGECVIHTDFHLEELSSFGGGIVRCEYNWCQPRRENDDYILTKVIKGYS